MDERTPEQVHADEALDVAIRNTLTAYGLPEDRLLLRWIVLCKTSGVTDGGGSSIDGDPILYPGHEFQWSDLLGMLRVATLREEHNYIEAVIENEVDDGG